MNWAFIRRIHILANSTYYLCHVSQSIRTYRLGSHWLDFHTIFHLWSMVTYVGQLCNWNAQLHFHNNVYANVPQCCIICTLPILFNIMEIGILRWRLWIADTCKYNLRSSSVLSKCLRQLQKTKKLDKNGRYSLHIN
jgi:hypothetical protein